MDPTRPRKKKMVTKSLFESDYDLSGLLSQFIPAREKTGLGEGILSDIYRAIVESASDSMYIVDRYCRYLFMNGAHLKRLDLTLEEVVGRTYGEFHSEEQKREFEDIINEVLTHGLPAKQEHRSGRDSRYFLRTFNLLKSPSGEKTTAAVVVISKDITEWKQAEVALREGEEKYRTILNGIADGYYEVDLQGNLMFVNPSMTSILGYSEEELLGLNNRQFMDKENARTVFQVFNTV
ncbi:MAG TPA: PAS domain-containing protein, partial [Syntrophales bacterium]|nr:PAS domain-containing protein [Syntrophales bacterium]